MKCTVASIGNAKARSAEASGNVATKKANSEDGFKTARMMKITASDRRSGLVVQNDDKHASKNKQAQNASGRKAKANVISGKRRPVGILLLGEMRLPRSRFWGVLVEYKANEIAVMYVRLPVKS